jgi:predicted outer membrane repeat protein
MELQVMSCFDSGRTLVVWLACMVMATVTAQAQTTWYVDDDAPAGGNGLTWPTAFKYLQDGLAVAEADDEIRVAGGTYKPDLDEAGLVTPGDREATFELVSGVGLYGGYAGIGAGDPDERDVTHFETILSGDLNGDDGPDFENYGENSRHVARGGLLDANTVVDGLVVTGGSGSSGAGLNLSGGRPTIANCVIRNNCGSWGGGMYSMAATTVSACTFRENLVDYGGGGALVADQTSLTLIGCLFDRNHANPSSDWDHLGGGAVFGMLATVNVTNCVFTSNSSTELGGAVNSLWTSTTLTNCSFSGNHARNAGAVSLWGSQNAVTNCAFFANAADEVCGGVRAYYTDAAVSNCILWNNQDAGGTDEGAQIAHFDDGATTVSYCCIQHYTGTYGDTGTIVEDPRFVDPDGADDVIGTPDDDLRVAAGSPCIDAGDNEALPWDLDDLNGDGQIVERIPFDLAGSPRFLDDPDTTDTGAGIAPIVDMGAYELLVPGLVSSVSEVSVPEGATATFTICLATAPAEPLTVTVAPIAGDPDITVQSGAGLHFDSDDFDIPQPVTLVAALDDDDLSGETTIEVAAPGLVALHVIASEIDTDATATVVFVNAEASPGGDGITWESAFADLQEALDAAADIAGEVQIWVAAGAYTPDRGTADPEATFELRDNLALLGGFAGDEDDPDQRDPFTHRTVLSGDLGAGQYAQHIVTADGPSDTAILDGFEISGGSGTLGAGLYVVSARPTIRDCAFVDNEVRFSGAAVCSELFGHPTFTRCTFANNSATMQLGGAVHSAVADATFVDCVFVGNSARDGGALSTLGGEYWLTNCSFRANTAESSGGALYSSNCEMYLANCTFSQNDGDGAANYWNGWATLVNCDFSGNEGRALVVRRRGDIGLHNCILWGNSYLGSTDEDAQIHLEDPEAHLDVQYSCVQGWTGMFGGIGNIGDDPMFADTDLRLAPGSPCIDVGSNWLVLPDHTDLDGDGDLEEPTPLDLDREGRFFDDPNTPDGGGGVIAIVDMGAYEFGGTGEQFCSGDLDGDRDIGIGDLAILIAHYGIDQGALPCEGDVDYDGDVDLSDLAWLLPCYGDACDQ